MGNDRVTGTCVACSGFSSRLWVTVWDLSFQRRCVRIPLPWSAGKLQGRNSHGLPSARLITLVSGSNYTKPQKKAARLYAACSLKHLSFTERSLKSAWQSFWQYVKYREIHSTLNHRGFCVKNLMRREQGQSAHCGLCHG